jgi:cell fate regulator YaaT (PSP1 superfamily)
VISIDTPTQKKQEATQLDSPTTQTEYKNLYESIILGKINQQLCNKSGCFFCYSELEKKVPIDYRNIVEVECNGLISCSYCLVSSDITDNIYPHDFVIVKCDETNEIAQIKLVGEIVRLKRYSLNLYKEDLPIIVRKTTSEDMEKLKKNLQDEERACRVFRILNDKMNLFMKLINVHYQFDRKKLFFFFTADGRVDFRELAKELAAEFKTRIELRQIGVRDEAKKIGGIGTCGREFCCNSFLSGFKRITTQFANEQNLLSSMGKLSGPCSKLKCCLSFEADETFLE